MALSFRLWLVAPASGVLVGAVVPNLAPCRCGASRRPISQGGISHGISIAGCGCNSAARFPDSQPCREFQPHLANQCKVRLIPVSPDQTWFILHDKMHARLNVCQFTAVKNDSCIACTARIIQLYCCTRTVCAIQINIEPCAVVLSHTLNQMHRKQKSVYIVFINYTARIINNPNTTARLRKSLCVV